MGASFASRVVAGQHFSVGRQGQQRPAISVHIVFEIKHFRKTGPSRFRFGPRSIGVLCLNQIINAAPHALTIRIIERQQTHHSPRRLRRSTRTLPFENRIVVSITTFAPTAILVLNADVCENKMSPMLTDLKTALVDKVSKKELTIVGAVVINGWKTKSDKAQWCSTANKNLKKMEKKYNDYIAAGN